MTARQFSQAAYQALIDAIPTKPLHPGRTTNAAVNRDRATEAFKAGKTPAQIADQWPEVFCLVDGKLAQLYDYKFAGDSGLYETTRMITRESAERWIHPRRRKGGL